MTNAPVTNNKASNIMNLGKNVNAPWKGSKSDSFSQVMDKTRQDGTEKSTSEPRDDSAVHAAAKVDNPGKKVLKKQDTADVRPEGVDTVQNQQEAMDEAAQKIVEDVAQQLGIPVEEVMNALQKLELTPMDLLSKDNLANLLVELSPDGDLLSLLTDEDMYGIFAKLTKVVETTVQDLKDVFSLTDEEFDALLEECKKTSVPGTSAQNTAGEALTEVPQTGPEEDQAKAETPKANVTTETLTDKAVQPKTETAGKVIPIEVETKPAQKEETQTVQPETPAVSTKTGDEKTSKDLNGQESSGGRDAKEDGNTGKQTEQPLFQTVANRFNQVQEVPKETQVLKQMADTESIMKQIMDYMKIQVKADMTQMEIQLHPASLGSINVAISSREGVITAQFTAQSEGVKAALESQIVQLRENFNEQGLKVEAVEVTIASHQFERQMNGEQREGSSEASEARKKGIRRINLGEMEELEGTEIEEADKITADMMVRNGNTVDYTA